MSDVSVLIHLYRVKRNLQHLQSDVDLVTHIKDREVEKKAWREEIERSKDGFQASTFWVFFFPLTFGRECTELRLEYFN